jgi:hypothetical protein
MNNIFNLASVRATRVATPRRRPLLDAVAKVVTFPARDRITADKRNDSGRLVAGWHVDHATRRLVCRWRDGNAEPSSPCITSSRLLRATLIGIGPRAA